MINEGLLVIAILGGSFRDAQDKAYLHEYETANPAAIYDTRDSIAGLAELKAQSDSGKVTWDVMSITAPGALIGCEQGYLAPLPDRIDRTDFYQTTDCSVSHVAFSVAIGYNPDKVQPSRAADFFDLERFPGLRGMRKQPKYTLELALMADGVEPSRVYEVLSTRAGVERAFAKLDTIKDSIIWWKAGAQAPQMLADGQVVMTTSYSGRIELAGGKTLWDGQVLAMGHWAVPAGAPHPGRAWEFVEFVTGPERNGAISKYMAYGPGRKDATVHSNDLPTSHGRMESGVIVDPEFWATHGDWINHRFSVWLSR